MKSSGKLIFGMSMASILMLAPAVSSGFASTFNSNAEQLLFTSSDAPEQPSPFTPGDCPDCPFDLTNNTGTTWTDFHFRLALGQGSGTFWFVDFIGGGYDGDGYEGPGSGTFPDPSTLDVIGLNIANGGTYRFTVDMDSFELLGTYQLFGTPTTDGNGGQVPLPGALLLMAGGLVGLTLTSWRQRPRD